MSKYANLVNSLLVEKIEDYIDQCQLTAGDCLPSEREFCEILGVSRVTLRQAVRKLCESGVLTNVQGKGTFLTPRRIVRNILEMKAPPQDSYKLISLQKIKAEGSVSVKLKLNPRSEVWQIKRIRLSDNQRISIETSHIPVHYLKSLNLEQLEEKSVCAFYNDGNENLLTTSNIRISIGTANFEESEWLDIPEGSYITVENHLVCREDIPVEYFTSVSSASKVKYSVTLKA